jgi:hypothetical protein
VGLTLQSTAEAFIMTLVSELPSKILNFKVGAIAPKKTGLNLTNENIKLKLVDFLKEVYSSKLKVEMKEEVDKSMNPDMTLDIQGSNRKLIQDETKFMRSKN